MYFTHHFPNHRTLSRAQYWLTQFGIEPYRLEVRSEGHPRIGFNLGLADASKARAIIHAVEAGETEEVGPDIWDLVAPADRPGTGPATGSPASPIGWHPRDLDPLADDRSDWVNALSQAMSRDA